MSIFDSMELIEKAFTKDHILQSISDYEVLLGITDKPSNSNMQSSVSLMWHVGESSYLGNNKNTAGHDLSYITASFDCEINVVEQAKKITVTRFDELEVEHDEATRGLDGNFFIGRDGKLGLAPKDFKDVFKKALANYNDNDYNNYKHEKRVELLIQ